MYDEDFCDQIDCTFHPNYKEETNNTSQRTNYNQEEITGDLLFYQHINKTTKISFNGFTFPLPCIFCKYRKQLDMKSLYLVKQAKNLLQGD